MEKFTFFWKGELSQWYPCSITVNNIEYTCCEQFMMAGKAILFKDNDTLIKIMNAKTPREQKALGREVKNFNKAVWDANARDIVFKGNMAKFTQHPTLKKLLLATAGTTLVEASPKDVVWGVGLAEDDPRAQDRSTWNGLNWLGETLTKVREAIIVQDGLVTTPADTSADIPAKTSASIATIPADKTEEVEKLVKELCDRAELLYKEHTKLLKDFSFKSGESVSESLSKYIMATSKLAAISLIGDYENVNTSMHRGMKMIYKLGAMDVSRIEPSGKECAKIELFSKIDRYVDSIPSETVTE